MSGSESGWPGSREGQGGSGTGGPGGVQRGPGWGQNGSGGGQGGVRGGRRTRKRGFLAGKEVPPHGRTFQAFSSKKIIRAPLWWPSGKALGEVSITAAHLLGPHPNTIRGILLFRGIYVAWGRSSIFVNPDFGLGDSGIEVHVDPAVGPFCVGRGFRV